MKNQYAQHIKSCLDSIISEMDKNPSLFAKNPISDFTRKRKLEFGTLIRLILSMRGNSLNKEIYDYFKESNEIMTSSAFVQQRGKLLPETFEYILREFNRACSDKETFNSYHLYAVDGTDISISTNPESECYCISNQHQKGINQIHANALYDICNKTYTDCILQPRQKSDERQAATEMIKRNTFPNKSIIIADRGYEGFNLMRHIIEKENLDFIIRIKNGGLLEVKNEAMEQFDKEIDIKLATKLIPRQGYRKMTNVFDFPLPCIMNLRVCRFEIRDNEYETLLTTLDSSEFPLEKNKRIISFTLGC